MFYQHPKLSHVEFSSKGAIAVFSYYDNYDYLWDGIPAGKSYQKFFNSGNMAEDIEKWLKNFTDNNVSNIPLSQVSCFRSKKERFKALITKQLREKSYGEINLNFLKKTCTA